MAAVIRVFIMKSGALEGSEMLSGDRFELGASPAASLQLEGVADRHAVLFVHEGRLALQALAPGVLVNGEAVTTPRLLGPRDDVVIGNYTLKFSMMSTAPQAAVPAPVSVPVPIPIPVSMAPSVARQAQGVILGGSTNPLSSPEHTLPAATARPPASAVHQPTPSPTTQPVARANRPTAEVTVRVPPPPPVTEPPALFQVTVDDSHTVVSQEPQGLASRDTVVEAPRGPVPPALVFAPRGDEQEDEDDDEDHTPDAPPWSLTEALLRPRPDAGKHTVVEVIHHRDDHLQQHVVLKPGQRFVLGQHWTKAERLAAGLDKVLPLVRFAKAGVAEISAGGAVNGRVLRQGQSSDLAAGAHPLVDGELCNLRVNKERILVRFTSQPQLLWTKEDGRLDRASNRVLASSAGVGTALLVGMLVLSWIASYRSRDEEVIQLEDDGFAEVVMKDIELEEPKKEEKPPEPTPVPTEQKQPEPQKNTPKEATPQKVADNTPPEPTPEPPKPGVLSVLADLPKLNDSSSAQNLDAALSNIKGVRVPGGGAGFKTSALVGKGPSSGVQVGGTGGVDTSGINSTMRSGAAGVLGGAGDRAVAGRVTGQPRLTQIKGQGELSKEEIQRVVSSHMGEIQYCYEKQLRTSSDLSGRVQLEWVIGPTGAITNVKVGTSTLNSQDAVRCMMDKVKTWRFPKPRGTGSVTVTYPFIFNTV